MAIKNSLMKMIPFLIIFIIKDNALIFNSIFRSVKSIYNEIYSDEIVLNALEMNRKIFNN